MKTITRLALASLPLLAVLLAGTRSAHQGALGNGPPLDQLYPGPLALADFGKIVAGEFTGDLKLDAIVMDGMFPKLLVAPETYDTAITLGSSANDIATLSGVLPEKDALLLVNTAGLWRYERDSAGAQWLVTPLRGAGTAWPGAKKVAVGQLDGTGLPDIVGIAANGRDVLIEYGNPDGSYEPGPTFAAFGQVVTDLWLLNWREDAGAPGTDEIALSSLQGVELRSPSGAFVDGIPSALATPILGAVLDDAGTPLQRLALVAKVGSNDYCTAYGDAGIEPYSSLGAAGVVSLAAGDADADGDSDLFLGITSETELWRLDNRSPAAPTFLPSLVEKFAYGPQNRDPADNHAGLAPGDFDSDGALDVLAPAQGDLGPVIAVYGSFDLVNVESDNVGAWKTSILEVTFLTTPGADKLEFRFTRPATILDHEPALGETLQLSVKFFHTGALGEGTNPAPWFESVVAVPPPPFGTVDIRMPVHAGYSLETSTDLYSIVARQRVVSDSDEVLDIGPALTAIFTPEPSVPTVTADPRTQSFLQTLGGPSSTPIFGGLDIGPTVPSMDPNQEPQDGD